MSYPAPVIKHVVIPKIYKLGEVCGVIMDDPMVKKVVGPKMELHQHPSTLLINDMSLCNTGVCPDVWEKYLVFSAGEKILKKGDYILHVGDFLEGLYLITEGSVVSRLLGADGLLRIISITCNGCVFGEQFFFHKQPSTIEAITLADTKAHFFDRQTVFEIIQNDVDAFQFLSKSLAIKYRYLCDQLENASLRTILQNICHILYNFCTDHARTKGGSCSIKLSHQDLADMLGIHRVSVTRNLSILKNRGIVDYKYKEITVRDVSKLVESCTA